MLGTCPQIMAVLGSLILYVLGKYLGVQWEGRIDPHGYGEAVECPSLEAFKSRGDVALGDVFSGCGGVGAGLDDLRGFFPT